MALPQTEAPEYGINWQSTPDPEIATRLSEPFPKKLHKTKPGRGRKLTYIEAVHIIRRLNEVLGPTNWGFEPDDSTLDINLERKEVRVLGRLTTGLCTKAQYGGSDIQFKKGTTEPLSIIDDAKSAATDALKKCATMLGIALDLYEDPKSRTQPPATTGKPDKPEPELTPPKQQNEPNWRGKCFELSKQIGFEDNEMRNFINQATNLLIESRTEVTDEEWKVLHPLFKQKLDEIQQENQGTITDEQKAAIGVININRLRSIVKRNVDSVNELSMEEADKVVIAQGPS